MQEYMKKILEGEVKLMCTS